MRLFLALIALALSVVEGLAPSAYASCGLSLCPLEGHRPTESNDHRWLYSVDLQRASFDVGVSGAYTRVLTKVEYVGAPGWVFGAALPYIQASVSGTAHTGLGNPVILGEKSTGEVGDWKTKFGAQVELPYGNEGAGLASRHTSVLPTVSGIKMVRGGDFFLARLGYRHTLDDHKAAAPLVVNPHAKQEILYRFGAGTHWMDNDLMTQLFLDGQQVISGAKDKTFVTMGILAVKRMKSDWDGTLGLELPVTTPARFDYRLTAGFIYRTF